MTTHLEDEVERLRAALDVAVYFADNLQRVIDHKPVRALAESRASFNRARKLCSMPENEAYVNHTGITLICRHEGHDEVIDWQDGAERLARLHAAHNLGDVDVRDYAWAHRILQTVFESMR